MVSALWVAAKIGLALFVAFKAVTVALAGLFSGAFLRSLAGSRRPRAPKPAASTSRGVVRPQHTLRDRSGPTAAPRPLSSGKGRKRQKRGPSTRADRFVGRARLSGWRGGG